MCPLCPSLADLVHSTQFVASFDPHYADPGLALPLYTYDLALVVILTLSHLTINLPLHLMMTVAILRTVTVAIQ